MFHDVHIEWGLNAKAYFEAYRGLCRIRYEYALSKILAWSEIPNEKRVAFWTKVAEYWKKKLAETYKREDEYFGH